MPEQTHSLTGRARVVPAPATVSFAALEQWVYTQPEEALLYLPIRWTHPQAPHRCVVATFLRQHGFPRAEVGYDKFCADGQHYRLDPQFQSFIQLLDKRSQDHDNQLTALQVRSLLQELRASP
jgi:hypothetical protein